MLTSAPPQVVVPILGYHSISDEHRDGTMRWSVSPGAFDEHMALLAQGGCTSLTVSAYTEALQGTARLPDRPVLITFDDGFADLARKALPVLRRYGLTATAYVITARLGTRSTSDDSRMLDWGELAELQANRVEIGSHSHTHRELDCLRRFEVRSEVGLSKLLLEEALRGPVSSFAYPYGYSSAGVRREVRAAGYTSACAVKNALSHDRDDVFALARVLVQRDTSIEAIGAFLDGQIAPLSWSGERWSTRAWRLVRRGRRMVNGITSAPAGIPMAWRDAGPERSSTDRSVP